MFEQFGTRLTIPFLTLFLVSIIASYSGFTPGGINNFSKISALSQISIEDFRESLDNLVHQSQHLTKSYHDEIGRWRMNQYDNYTLEYITDSFIPKFEKLTKAAEKIAYPEGYKYILDALVNSLRFETESYKHFRDYLLTGNTTEDEISNYLFSRAFEYEQVYSKFLYGSPSNSDDNITKLISLR
jgi:hypothetical protein